MSACTYVQFSMNIIIICMVFYNYIYTHTHCESVAATQIEAIASHINEYIRQHENFKKMLLIQNCLTGHTVPGILSPARKFVHEGRLMKV